VILKQRYAEEMETFRVLTKRLLDEC